MNQGDRNKKEAEKVPIKDTIPAYNSYPLKDIKRWVKGVYHKARIRVSWRKAQKIKEMMPIETADYAEKKVLGWRLVAPAGPGQVSPLQATLTALRPEIVPTRWGEFRHRFVKLLKLAFNAICEANYDPKVTAQVNGWLKDLVREYLIDPVGRPRRVVFVPHPETAQDRNSDEIFNLRSNIWSRFAGTALDRTQYRVPSPLGVVMEMTLEISDSE